MKKTSFLVLLIVLFQSLNRRMLKREAARAKVLILITEVLNMTAKVLMKKSKVLIGEVKELMLRRNLI